MENEKSKLQKTFNSVEQACHEINGFQEFYEQLEEKMVLSGHARSTLSNYVRTLAHLSLKFGKLPQQIPEKDINGYLANLARGSKTPSLSIFKHTIYGLRYCYHMLGMNEKAIKLPSLKHDHKLPVVLNYQECIAMFKAPKLLKHRVLLSLIYSAGLRVQEASHLKIGDLDYERMMIHIRQSKYKKDRYVPLSPLILVGLRKYISASSPVEYLFNGKKRGEPMSIRSMQWIFRETARKCKIQKSVSLHSLRHSYATHLLEFGMDILSIKELMGHARIQTTMIYMHVAEPRRTNLFSPFDRLYDKP